MSFALSVILTTRADYETIRETIRHLRAQTITSQLELVIVGPTRAQLGLVESELSEFAGWQVVEAGVIRSVGHGNTLGIHGARAPIVALAEDHAFPDRLWAEALLRAHMQSCAAVGPVVRNANPVNQISWADLLIGYAPWLEPARAGAVEFLPGHNSSYKRDLLLEYGDRLEAMLGAEAVLHWDLRARGHTLLLEPEAKLNHVNFTRLDVWIPVQFHAGRVFAASRTANEHWSLVKRALYVCAAPLIPFVRLARIFPVARKIGRCSALPMLLIGLLMDGLGQQCGYAVGAGRSADRLPLYEFNRLKVNALGRRAWRQ